MLGIDRTAARYTWTATAVLLLIWLVYLVRSTLFIFVLAVLFAYLLSPLVDLLDRALPSRTLDRALPSRTRTGALALAYIIFLATVVFVVMQVGATVAVQAEAFQQDLPQRIAKFEAPNPKLPAAVNDFKAQLIQRIRTQLAESESAIVATVARAGFKFITVAGDLLHIVIVPILAFFFLKEGRAIRENILGMLPDGPRRGLLDDILADLHLLLAHYMRALVILSVATFVAYAIFFGIMGVPYGMLLAVAAAVLEFIPMLGPLSAGVVIVLVSAVSDSHALAVLVFLLVYRVFQDYVLQPHLMGQGVEVHPLLVLFGVFAGAEAGGIAGTFISVPLIALVRILVLRIRKARMAEHLGPARATLL
jgi:predicted PurR-regulated permease PerM